MEIGHMALHGAFDRLPDVERYQSEGFHWKAPIDEAAWHTGHNIRHHGYTNIEGSDPDLSFAVLRLSDRVPYRRMHRLQPLSNLFTWFGFGAAIQLHVTGMLDLYLDRHGVTREEDSEKTRAAQRRALSKLARYYAREYVFFPALAGPFFWKTLLGNALAEAGRDVYSAATIYCGHVGAKDYPRGARPKGRARWYVMQAEASRNIEIPYVLSVLSGALDKQIEHHLFPRLPPNRLREIAPRVRKICEQHAVAYLSKGWPDTLRDVFRSLYSFSRPGAAVREEVC
jgi:linoleoyl-CoA desaturase